MSVELATRLVAADRIGVEAAAAALTDGELVAFPTETVYGLGADATNSLAVARLYAAKQRPSFNPLIVHVADFAQAATLAEFSASARQLAEALWPGPLTLVLPKRAACNVSELATAGLPTIAIRVPAHPVTQELLATVSRPIVAPSANRSGRVSPTTAAHVLRDLEGHIDLILDAGPSNVGLESTIVGWEDGKPTLLRPGGIPRGAIERVLRTPVANRVDLAEDAVPLAPGQLTSHYAPRARLRLDARTVRPGEALLAFGPTTQIHIGAATSFRNLSPSADLCEAAANLFAHLRALDESGIHTIAVMPIPQHGLGEAINDRLRRAAAPRPSPDGHEPPFL